MKLLNLFRRSQVDEEAAQRAKLLQTGRITEGMILDVINDEATGGIAKILYSYTAGGVEYESAQTLNAEQRGRAHDYAPGSRVTVRFDPRRPGNSIVV
jgi:hypothetical protein